MKDLPRCPECKDAIVTEFGSLCSVCEDSEQSQMQLTDMGDK